MSVEFPPPSPEKEEEEYLAEELICSFCNEVFRKRSRASTFVNHIAKQHLELFLEGIRFKKPTTFKALAETTKCTGCPKHCEKPTDENSVWDGSFKKPMSKKQQKPKSAEEYVIRVEEEAIIEEEVETEVIKRRFPKFIPRDTIVISRKNKKCNECQYKTDKASNLKRH